MPRENMALTPEDVPGSSVATRESALRTLSIAPPLGLRVDGGEVANEDVAAEAVTPAFVSRQIMYARFYTPNF